MSSNLKRGSSSFGDVGCAGQWSEGGDVKKEHGSSSAKPTPLFGSGTARSTASSSSNQNPQTSSSNDTTSSSHPAAKKSKLAPATFKNPFEVLSSEIDDSNASAHNQAAGTNKGASSFLKPSKLDWGASSVFKTVQSNSAVPVSRPDSNSFSSQFLNLTRVPSCGNRNPVTGGELNGNSSNGDSKNLTCSPTTTKGEELAHPDESPASNTPTGEGSSQKVISDAPLFGVPNSTPAASSANELFNCSNEAGSGSKLFMFGQNLQDRVLVPANVDPKNDDSTESTSKTKETTSGADSAQNQSKRTVAGGDLKPTPVFASSSCEPLIFKEAGEKTEKKVDSIFSSTVPMQTGEENEITVLQIQARLFQYDSAVKNWRERGRGLLKLNESKFEGNGKTTTTPNIHNSARILMRTHATYQLVLNTKLFADQLLEKASDKALKLSCFNEENTGMSLYTIKGSPGDIDCLFQQLKNRIDKLKQQMTSQENEQSSDEDQTRQESKQQEGTSNAEEKKETQSNCATNLGADDTSSGADSYYRSTTPSGHSLDENSRNTSPPLSSSEETNF